MATKVTDATNRVSGTGATLYSIYEFRVQAIIVFLLSFVLYFNTIRNDYALDDTVVLIQNEYVLEGVAGLKDIFAKDSYDSYYKQLGISNQVPGGRYRPLSIATFAIEQEFFGTIPADKVRAYFAEVADMTPEEKAAHEQKLSANMHVRHFVNVVLFALSVVLLLYVFRTIVFRNNKLMPFIAVLLFAVHPVHTEVVANIKSRDEILSLAFICITFIFAFRYRHTKQMKYLLLAMLAFFLAFLSKEYAISLVVLLPVSFYLFDNESLKKSLTSTLPYLIVIIVYAVIRIQILNAMPERFEGGDTDIQLNPYAYATGAQKVATEIATPMNYLRLLLWPHPLSSDYSYDSIPYKDWSSPLVWLSILIHLSLVFAFIYLLIKRHLLSFGVGFYLINLALVCNLFFNIGATMGERLIYHSSVGFVIIIAYFIVLGTEQIKREHERRTFTIGTMTLLVLLCGYKTMSRNADWKNDTTLFAQDINVVPNSFLVNVNVATTLVNNSEYVKDKNKRAADLHRGVVLLSKAIKMQDNYVLGYMNRSIAYMKLGLPDSMSMDLNRVMQLYPMHPQLPIMYVYAGQYFFGNKQYDKAYNSMLSALRLIPDYFPARNEMRIMDSSLAAMGIPRPVLTQ